MTAHWGCRGQRKDSRALVVGNDEFARYVRCTGHHVVAPGREQKTTRSRASQPWNTTHSACFEAANKSSQSQ